MRGSRPRRVGDRAHRRAGPVIIRDTSEKAQRAYTDIFGRNRGAEPWRTPAGTVDDVVEHLRPFGEIGFRHLIVGFPAPHDAETMERLMTEVKPRLAEAWA